MASTTSSSAPSIAQASNPSCPAFLSKLWLLVDDENTDELIHWSEEGNSFIVVDQAVFASQLLPLFFKHSNMASFIRQLNMYGFRKKAHIEDGALKIERTDIEFQHPHFLKGQIGQLEQIKRKVSGKEEAKVKTADVSKILTEVKGMKETQDGITGKLDSMKRENQALWREVISLRQRHDKQQKIVNRLIHFLISLVQPKVGTKRRQNHLMIEGVPDSSSHSGVKYARTLPPMRATIDELPDIDDETKLGNPLDLSSSNVLGRSNTLSDITGDVTASTGPRQTLTVDDILSNRVPADIMAVSSPTKPKSVEPVLQQAASPEILFPTTPGQASLASGTSEQEPEEVFGLEGVLRGDGDDSLLGGGEAVEKGGGGSELVVANTSSGDSGLSPSKDVISPSKYVMQRFLSNEEQKQELGDQLNYVQANLNDFQNLFLGGSPLNLDLAGLSDLQQIFDVPTLPTDIVTPLTTESNGTNTAPPLAGNELMTYTPSTSMPLGALMYDDEDSLLKSLDDDSIALSKQEQEDENNPTILSS